MKCKCCGGTKNRKTGKERLDEIIELINAENRQYVGKKMYGEPIFSYNNPGKNSAKNAEKRKKDPTGL